MSTYRFRIGQSGLGYAPCVLRVDARNYRRASSLARQYVRRNYGPTAIISPLGKAN